MTPAFVSPRVPPSSPSSPPRCAVQRYSPPPHALSAARPSRARSEIGPRAQCSPMHFVAILRMAHSRYTVAQPLLRYPATLVCLSSVCQILSKSPSPSLCLQLQQSPLVSVSSQSVLLVSSRIAAVMRSDTSAYALRGKRIAIIFICIFKKIGCGESTCCRLTNVRNEVKTCLFSKYSG